MAVHFDGKRFSSYVLRANLVHLTRKEENLEHSEGDLNGFLPPICAAKAHDPSPRNTPLLPEKPIDYFKSFGINQSMQ